MVKYTVKSVIVLRRNKREPSGPIPKLETEDFGFAEQVWETRVKNTRTGVGSDVWRHYIVCELPGGIGTLVIRDARVNWLEFIDNAKEEKGKRIMGDQVEEDDD